MIRKALPALCLALVAAALVSCAGLPKKAAPDDCLVLIKTLYINPQNHPVGRTYSFNFSSGYKPVDIGSQSFEYVALVIHEPGVMVETITSYVSDKNSRGPKSSDKLGYPLPYSPGKAVVADFVFLREIKEAPYNSDNNRTYYTSIGFVKAKDSEKQELLDKIRQDKSASAWFGE
jgi:hypothetical protein